MKHVFRFVMMTVVMSLHQQVSSQVDDTTSGGSGGANDIFFEFNNETVEGILGSRVELPCKITFATSIFNVIWFKEGQTLTLNSKRIIDDSRFSVATANLRDSSWNLAIEKLRENDSAVYKCIINVTPPASKFVRLIVNAPPSIDNKKSSFDSSVLEGSDLKLYCAADGIPKPNIRWFHVQKNFQGELIRRDLKIDGKYLIFQNISRLSEGVYECEAYNLILPNANRRTTVNVIFKPEVQMINEKIGQSLGATTMLQCLITANPMKNFLWQFKEEKIDADSGCNGREAKYCQDIWPLGSPHKYQLDLTIKKLNSSDYGFYTCVAESALGTSKASAFLYEEKSLLAESPVEKTSTLSKVISPSLLPFEKNLDINERKISEIESFPYNKESPSQIQVEVHNLDTNSHGSRNFGTNNSWHSLLMLLSHMITLFLLR